MDPLYTILTNLVTIVSVRLVTRRICLCLLVIHGASLMPLMKPLIQLV